tara:strand:+ start:2404 stop:3783 length:1380 start_codon:yes stop_codon:yes gene_type:complete
MSKPNTPNLKKLLKKKQKKEAASSQKTKIKESETVKSSEKILEKIGNRRFSAFIPTEKLSESKKEKQQKSQPKISSKLEKKAPKEKITSEKIHPRFSLPKFNIFEYLREKKLGIIEYFKKQIEKQQEKKAIIHERRQKHRFYLEKASLGIDPNTISKKIFNLCVVINLIISALLIYYFSTTFGITWATILASMATLWILIFIVLLFALWALFYLTIDLKIFRRKNDIEEVLPDYLQLTASNIKAGMTIDRALWYAVRPKFGVLAKEIEIVAKETMKGEDLKTALQKFADKYDSVLLKRTISLLIEGIESGGEIGGLLNKIAINIQENKIMKKEMAANVTTYVIFITFATVLAAPVLFGLSGVLIKVITSLGGLLEGSSNTASAGLSISFSGSGISFSDFKIFAIVSLITTSFFSSVIIATIKKGSAKAGLKYIPIFIISAIILFLIVDAGLGLMIGTFL